MLHQFLFDIMVRRALMHEGRCDIEATRRFVSEWLRRARQITTTSFAHEDATNGA